MKNHEVKHNALTGAKQLAVHYMKTLVEVARESFLILDADLKVISANPTFYETFRVRPEQTEDEFIYELGNGQWSITNLKTLLEEILPKKKVVKNYQVTHIFENIGEKTMLLNARQIDAVQLIILAIEDITVRKDLEKKLNAYTKELETKVAQRTGELADRIKELEALNKTMVGRELKMVELKKEIEELKKRSKNGSSDHTNGKNGNGKNGNGRRHSG